MTMSHQEGGPKRQNTAYGVFVQACWAQHTRQYPDELIHKEIEEFNKQCSAWWYNMPESDRDKFQEIADRSNQTDPSSGDPISGNAKLQTNNNTMYTRNVVQQQSRPINNNFGGSQNMNSQMRGGMGGGMMNHQGGKPSKPAKDPNAPKRPLSAYFLYANAVRDEVRRECPEMSTTEVAKESGQRWGRLTPEEKEKYENQSKELKAEYEVAMSNYAPNATYQQQNTQSKPPKKVKDKNAPKPALSAYFLFGNSERDKVREAHPEMSMPEIAKQLGKEWASLSAEEKQPYQERADDDRQRYEREKIAYQGGGVGIGVGSPRQPPPSPMSETLEGGAYLESVAMDLPLV